MNLPISEGVFMAWRPAVWTRIVTCIVLIATLFFAERGDLGCGDLYATFAIVGGGT